MHEKHYIHEIVNGFLINPNFSIEEYVKLINKSHLKYSKRLLTYKAFKKFKEDKQLTEQKIINYSKGNILTGLFSASPSNTETEIRTYCEKNKGSPACSCYEAVKVGADKYQMTYDKYEDDVKRISAKNQPKLDKYEREYKEYQKGLETYLNNLRKYEKSSDEIGACCAWNYCECTPTDTWAFSRTDNYGFFGTCSKYCKYTQEAIKSMGRQYTKTHEPKEPLLEEYPDRPADLTINTNCCINVINDVKKIKGVVQSCNQKIISIIKTEDEERKRKEEEERKRKEEEERKRNEEKERKRNEEKERKRKEEEEEKEERKRNEEEEEKEERKRKEEEEEKEGENNQIKNIIYISVGASFILLLLFILLRKK